MEHPGDELAILTFAGEDATTEFDRIHPPDVVEKYAPDAIMGVVGNDKAKKAKGAAKSALPVATDKGDPIANLEAWGDWRMEAFDDTPGVLLVNDRSYVKRLLLFNSRHHLWDLCHDFNSQHHLRDLCHYSLCEEFQDDRTGLHEVPFPCSFSLWCMSSGICTCSRDQTTSTGTVISTFVCTVQALDSRRTSSRNMCC